MFRPSPSLATDRADDNEDTWRKHIAHACHKNMFGSPRCAYEIHYIEWVTTIEEARRHQTSRVEYGSKHVAKLAA